ncbi:MAG: potassium transporter [Gammaproteobacteria bacterium]|jgi:trk system potassium uptake protein TrkH|nr:potassium transporter [Gammaproteobacteria bacterium]MDG2434552.1 TrkH family potassium uptake protein [Gammaproteobacteria bacterium]
MTLNNLKSVQKLLGTLVMLFSFTLLLPFIVSSIDSDINTASSFLQSFFYTLIAGCLLWFPSRSAGTDIRLHEGFIIVALFWIILALFGSIPFLVLPASSLTITDAIFESTSGLTTTGATVMSNLDVIPKGLLFYRAQLQWLGGLGIVVLAVAIMPLLGVGGMRLYKADSASSVSDTKLNPRQKETAKSLGKIYLALTLACIVCFWIAGMPFFDAICHGLTTVAIGGFSTHDASFGFYQGNAQIFWVASVFMILAGINFSLHFFAWKNKTLSNYLMDSEFKAYASLLLVVVLFSGLALMSGDNLTSFSELFFQVVSIGTTTGFTSSGYYQWPTFIPFLLLMLSFVGGCVGSTGGGLKVTRCLILLKQGLKEAKQLIHPNAEIPVKINKQSVDQNILDSVWGFVSVYIIVLVCFTLAMLATGMDVVTSFSSVAASLNNLGPGLGDVMVNYQDLLTLPKWICIAAMVLGRLEIFALLILFHPSFWQD